MTRPFDLRLVAISPDNETRRNSLIKHLEALARGGATAFMFREKSLATASFLELGTQLRERCEQLGLHFILNERSELAEPIGARIVHLTWQSRELAEHSGLERQGRIFGKSVHRLEEALAAEAQGFDYLVFGPIFATPSKVGLVEPQGLQALAELVQAVQLPVVAVGGLQPDRVRDLRQAGASGIAALSSLAAENAEAEAAALRRNWGESDD